MVMVMVMVMVMMMAGWPDVMVVVVAVIEVVLLMLFAQSFWSWLISSLLVYISVRFCKCHSSIVLVVSVVSIAGIISLFFYVPGRFNSLEEG